jgi:hypothetical protein
MERDLPNWGTPPDPRLVGHLYQAPDFYQALGEAHRATDGSQEMILEVNKAGHTAIRLHDKGTPCGYGSPKTRLQPDQYCGGCRTPLD